MNRPAERVNLITVPNILTSLRILLIPGIVVFAYNDGRTASLLASLLFLLASLTDYFDGYFARRSKTVTSMGKMFDPMADKVLVTASLVMLVYLHRAPAWIAIIIISRELAVSGLRSMASATGTIIQAESLGKYKTTFQSFALIFLFAHYRLWIVECHFVGTYFLYVALILGVWSGLDYFRKFLSAALRENQAPG